MTNLQTLAVNHFGSLNLPDSLLDADPLLDSIFLRLSPLTNTSKELPKEIRLMSLVEVQALLFKVADLEGIDLMAELEKVLSSPKTRIIP